MVGRPTGTVTFLFTDIEGSTQLWAEDSDAMSASLRLHDQILQETIESHGGYVFNTAGDAFCAAFHRASEAVRAASTIQAVLGSVDWPGPALRVRMGLHLGEAEERNGDYFGPVLNITARVAAAGAGGQVLVTAPVRSASAVDDLLELGLFRLQDVPGEIRLFQLGTDEFPGLRLPTPDVMVHRFDGFEVDHGARQLRSDGAPVHVEPQVFDVLAHLVTNHHRLVSREELLDEVWGGHFVSLSALSSRIKAARQSLGDDGRTQRYIRTEHGRGYQFVGSVEAVRDEPNRSRGRTAPGPEPHRGSNLPVVAHPLLGREREVDELMDLVDSAGLVTIIGPGGAGKTRLAVEVASRWAGRAGRPVTFVGLDSVREPDDVPSSIATSLRIDAPPGTELIVACAEWLAAGEYLLVLDNCEHVLGSVADVIAQMTSKAPSLQVLATSREPLRIGAEHVYRLGTLGVPAKGQPMGPDDDLGPCVELFAERARQSDQSFGLTRENASTVVELCRGLDGLPLAVELAASRVGSFGLPELVESLGNRLDVIRSQRRDLTDRHQSLRSTVEWSHRLLGEDAQRLHACLAKFPAGLSYGGVEALTRRVGIDAGADELVSQLVDASMIYRSQSDAGTRYLMLDTLREFGLEQLDRHELCETVDDALVDHALALAAEERSFFEPGAPQDGRSNTRTRTEIPNFRAARDIMMSRGDIDSIVELSMGLETVTMELGLAELWRWHEDAMELSEGLEGPVRHQAVMLGAKAARNRGELDEARRLSLEVLALDPDPWTKRGALHCLGMVSLFEGDPVQATDWWLQWDEIGGLGRGKIFSAMCSAYLGEVEKAESILDECSHVIDTEVPVDVEVNYHFVAGEVARIAGSATARESLERAIELGHEHEIWFSAGVSQVSLVSILASQGDTVAAARGYLELIEHWLRSGTWPQIWTTLRNAADLLDDDGDETAILIWSAAHSDPQAPALDEAASRSESERREAAIQRVGETRSDEIERQARRMPRSEVAERTITALSALAARG